MQEIFWTVLAALLGFGALGLLIWIYYRRVKPPKPKRRGRDNRTEAAVGALRSFARSNGFRLIAPARLKRGDLQADIDALVIGYFGIIGVKALGYNGQVYGAENEPVWVQVAPDGERVEFPNPVTEAAADVRVVRDALFSAKLKRVPVEVVCVFTASDAQLGLPRSTNYLTVKTLKDKLKSDKYLEDTGLDLDAVEAAIKGSLQLR